MSDWENVELGTLDDAANAINELYLSFIGAGFNEHQAMQLVLQVPCHSCNDNVLEEVDDAE